MVQGETDFLFTVAEFCFCVLVYSRLFVRILLLGMDACWRFSEYKINNGSVFIEEDVVSLGLHSAALVSHESIRPREQRGI